MMNNRLRQAWNGVELLFKKADVLLAGTPFQVPVGLVHTLIELRSAIDHNDYELNALMIRTQERLNAVHNMLANDNDADSKDLIQGFAEKLATKLCELDNISKKAAWRKILENEHDRLQLHHILRYIDDQIKDFQITLALKIDQNIFNLRRSFDQLQLNNWPFSRKAIYNYNLEGIPTLSRGACLQGTRVSILEHIYEWAQDSAPTSPSVFWLTGHAGSGKSTIAYSVAEQFDKGRGVLKTLQATFFCSRQFEETKYQKYIIPTLVHQLAHHSRLYAESLLSADQFDSVNKQLLNQMDDLLVEPWQKSVSGRPPDLPPYLIVIDALDEIEGKGGVEFLQELLMTINSGHLQGLKFLVTSRPDPGLAELCRSFPPSSVCHLQDVSEEQAHTDIMKYLHNALPMYENRIKLEELGRKANGLFIYASTAVRYISSGTSGEQHDLMRQLLDSTNNMKVSESPDLFNPTALIDNLYHQILSEAFSQVQKNHIEARLKILHTILCAEERISTSVAAGLLSNIANAKDMKERADDLIKKLHAVLYVKENKGNRHKFI
ncbi:hypothetical protein H2248_008138 [Termitomyces sp. 'cryptogamus']|nr:hypothetical protein H2248_008138 [Termitomyces sp. 'cryptogamus']